VSLNHPQGAGHGLENWLAGEDGGLNEWLSGDEQPQPGSSAANTELPASDSLARWLSGQEERCQRLA